MNTTDIQTTIQIKALLDGAPDIRFTAHSQQEAYQWITSTLVELRYHSLKKAEKGDVFRYLCKMTGYSRQQMSRLIQQYRETGRLAISIKARAQNGFKTRYTRQDVALLAEIDKLHHTLSGTVVKKLCARALTVFHQQEYANLSRISVAHIYNLRKSFFYKQKHQYYTKTIPVATPIGVRRKPRPEGKPGYIRIDTVHQGDQDKQKGVYHINAVDEVTQFEIVCSVEKISEAFLIPALGFLLESYPFTIIEFHSDNGSEYINKRVAELLQKLLIEQTKSRPRHCNDNALVESKNGSVIRKHFGYVHIPQKWAADMNAFNREHFNPYINFHRPCHYVEIIIDKRGKEKKTYPYKKMMTPYDKLRSLPDALNYLKPGVTFKELDAQALCFTDNEAARRLNEAKQLLFNTIFE